MDRGVGLVRTPDVELRWWQGCPSTERALDELREAMWELGLDAGGIRMTEIETDEGAEAVGFVGSPTILIDGGDVQPPGDDEPVGLSCRVYRRGDGRVLPTPDPDRLRAALSRAAHAVQVNE